MHPTQLFYRSHPEIVKAVSYAAYEQNETSIKLTTPVQPHERANITNSLVPLSHKDYPILLLQCIGESTVQASYSRCNVTQCDLAVEIVKHIGRLTSNLSIAITSYYSGDTKYVQAKIDEESSLADLSAFYESFSNIEISTVSAYIGGEAQINILITDVTQRRIIENEDDIDDNWLQLELPEFIFEDRIATVAISRGTDLTIVIGHMDYLTSRTEAEASAGRGGTPGTVLPKFLRYAAQRAPVLNYTHYLTRIQSATEQRPTQYDPQGIIREPDNRRGIVQTCALNNSSDWYNKLDLNRPGRVRPAPLGV